LDSEGNFPNGTTTWQFNLKFDLEKERFSAESIGLLEMAGIDFDLNLKKGIHLEDFAEQFLSSGLVLNDDIHWITFHGIYDFAYLIKEFSNLLLPKDEEEFYSTVSTYFPNFYDIRTIINNFNWIRGSLSKICSDFDIKREGVTHQAGSDSLVTTKLFFKLLVEYSELIDFNYYKNQIFGLRNDNPEEEFKAKSIQYPFNAPYYNNGCLNAYNNKLNANNYSNNILITNGNYSNDNSISPQKQYLNPNGNGIYNNYGLSNNLTGYHPQNYHQVPLSGNIYYNNNYGINNNMKMKTNNSNLDSKNFYINNLYLNHNLSYKIPGSENNFYQNNIASN